MASIESHKILVNPELCRDCQTCALACSLYHEAECSLSKARLQIVKDMENYQFTILICRHCEEPNCVKACPCDAIMVDQGGAVLIDDEMCIHCGACILVCPYNAIFCPDHSDNYLKCDLCKDRSLGPLCVELCPTNAITLSYTFGG
jgi:anaerobic carbon-monoxide dehydrogenase iron sulfur subunit